MRRRDGDDVLTEEEAARFLSVSAAYLRRRVQAGDLAVVRDGPKFTRFLRGDLLDYLYRHRIAPQPRADDPGGPRQHRRQAGGWESVYRALMGEDQGEMSLATRLHAIFSEDGGQGLATLLWDLTWPELVRAAGTLMAGLSTADEGASLPSLVNACEELIERLSEVESSLRRSVAAPLQREEPRETGERLPDWPDGLTPCCNAPWRLPHPTEAHWQAARVCTRCGRVWTPSEILERNGEGVKDGQASEQPFRR